MYSGVWQSVYHTIKMMHESYRYGAVELLCSVLWHVLLNGHDGIHRHLDCRHRRSLFLLQHCHRRHRPRLLHRCCYNETTVRYIHSSSAMNRYLRSLNGERERNVWLRCTARSLRRASWNILQASMNAHVRRRTWSMPRHLHGSMYWSLYASVNSNISGSWAFDQRTRSDPNERQGLVTQLRRRPASKKVLSQC